MKKLRCAVIGCGRIGCGFDDYSFGKSPKTHAGSYLKHPETELVALCDVDIKKLKKYGKKFDVEGLYKKSSDMFRNENLDCVSICTLSDKHLELVKQASKFDIKGLFVEKPISNSLQNAKKIIQICKQHKITLALNHQRRFDPFYYSVKKLINKKIIGKSQLVNAYYGAGIANTGSHLFDLLRLFFGNVISLQGNFSKNNSNNAADPNINCSLEFGNGTICYIHALDLKNYGILELDIIGTKGRMRLDLSSNNLEYFKISSNKTLVYKNLVPSKINVNSSTFSSIYLCVQNLVKAIKQKKDPLCTGEDGYKSLELVIASLLSAQKKKKMNLPLTSKYIINSK